jgi:hypothetical protein
MCTQHHLNNSPSPLWCGHCSQDHHHLRMQSRRRQKIHPRVDRPNSSLVYCKRQRKDDLPLNWLSRILNHMKREESGCFASCLSPIEDSFDSRPTKKTPKWQKNQDCALLSSSMQSAHWKGLKRARERDLFLINATIEVPLSSRICRQMHTIYLPPFVENVGWFCWGYTVFCQNAWWNLHCPRSCGKNWFSCTSRVPVVAYST